MWVDVDDGGIGGENVDDEEHHEGGLGVCEVEQGL